MILPHGATSSLQCAIRASDRWTGLIADQAGGAADREAAAPRPGHGRSRAVPCRRRGRRLFRVECVPVHVGGITQITPK
jgi:hypothetical protein